MATSSDVRDWAGSMGIPHSRKGKLPGALITDWDASHPGDPYQPDERGGNGAGPDYPDPDFDTAFAELPPEDPGETGEVPPKRPPRAKRTTGGGWFRRDKTARGKRKPRISTEDFLSAVWRGAAGMARPLPPLHRTLKVQAPVAGMILEDAVRDTIIDPFLQPLARLAGTGKAAGALIGPPVLVTFMSMYGADCAAHGRDPNPLVWESATEGLRQSLMAWMDIAGPKFEAAIEKEREFESKYGQSVDAMIAWLFSAPADPATEDANIRRAQGIRDDDHAGM